MRNVVNGAANLPLRGEVFNPTTELGEDEEQPCFAGTCNATRAMSGGLGVLPSGRDTTS